MSSPAERTEETKWKLLVAARELIVEQGWSSVSNRAISQRAGVNLALINYHFGGKRGLLAAMLDRAAEEIAMSYGPATVDRPEGEVGDFVSAAIRSVPRLVGDPNARVLAVAMLEATYEPELAASVGRSLADLRQRIEVSLSARTPKAADPGLVTLLAALLDGVLLHSLLDPTTDLQAAAAAAKRVTWTPSRSRSRSRTRTRTTSTSRGQRSR